MLNSKTPMATLTIRNVEPSIKERLRVRAAQNGRSMEAELRAIVTDAIETPTRPPEMNLYDRIRARFEPLGGVELELPPRGPMREPPTFE
jgi:plasmid stability protein